MKLRAGYCPICGARVAIMPGGPGPCGEIEPYLRDLVRNAPHTCNSDDAKAMARIHDYIKEQLA